MLRIKNIGFLKVTNKPIGLFQNINDNGEQKAIGLLKESSIIQVDSVFYREIFHDTSKKGWFTTFNVWYALTINNQKYYTDYKVHDFIAYHETISTYPAI